MITMKIRYAVVLMLALALASCKDASTDTPDEPVVEETDFNAGMGGWNAVFAAYPEADSTFYELESGIRPLPPSLDQTRKGFLLSGNNHSDALQMFLVRRLGGLEPETRYAMVTEVELASKYPNGSVGIGGSPGNSVYVVAKFATHGYALRNDRNNHLELILNPGADSAGESALMMDLGDVSIPAGLNVYQLISRTSAPKTGVVRTDAHGVLWALIGTWSGFEGISSLYYTKIRITLTKR